jgi:phosphoribosylformylglycinamidine (FGAM) synthase PurS component
MSKTNIPNPQGEIMTKYLHEQQISEVASIVVGKIFIVNVNVNSRDEVKAIANRIVEAKIANNEIEECIYEIIEDVL